MQTSRVDTRIGVATSPIYSATNARPTLSRLGLAVIALCGILSPAVYIATDIASVTRYPGFSYTDQAVSELFAIGAPTSTMVVRGFSVSSLLLLFFAVGMWRVVAGWRHQRLLALMLALSAINALVLWNGFPMHMRGAEKSLTDTVHLALAANPFWIVSLILAALAFRNGFRTYSLVTICVLVVLAAYGFSFASALVENAPTPGMGLAERAAQYLDGVWQAVLAVVVWRQVRGHRSAALAPRLS